MPEQLKKSEVEKEQDPTAVKQWDEETPTDKKFEDFYAIADKLHVAMLGTYRVGTGPVARCMAVAKRTGPDFLFIANGNSQKFSDLAKNKEATVTFHNSSNQDWVSVTGEATTTSNDDPRIKELWSKPLTAWFGDLGDGVHNGTPEDPRMKLIEIQSKYISYWKHEVSTIGFATEVYGAALTGGVAKIGTLRQMKADEIKQARSKDGTMSS